MAEMHDDIVTLVDEEGREHQFHVLDILTVDEKEYAILVPAEEVPADSEADEQEAVIFRIVGDGEEQALLVVEDDDEWQAVADAWQEAYATEDDHEE
jgi:uncharacterized protein YrzB (UPF0473 family)